MSRITILACAAGLFSIYAQSSLAQLPALTSELIECREARIVARQAMDLTHTLTELGLTEVQATEYLHTFRRMVDECETNPGHQVQPPPTFPALSATALRREGLLEDPMLATPSIFPKTVRAISWYPGGVLQG
jgi:hypothetical protein